MAGCSRIVQFSPVCAKVVAVSAIMATVVCAAEIPIVGSGGLYGDNVTVERFVEAREAGLTGLRYEARDAEDAIKALDVARAAGLKLMLLSRVMRGTPAEAEAFVKAVKDHPALGWYVLVDEPRVPTFVAHGVRMAEIQKIDPLHHVFVNWYGRVHRRHEKWYGEGVTTYEEYTRRSLSEMPLTALSFDQYPIMDPGVFPKQPFRPASGPCLIATNWYHTLETVSSLARGKGIPFWAYSLSRTLRHQPGHDYPVPTVAHMKLQHYSNLAYGAQGLLYYSYSLSPIKTRNMSHACPLDTKGRRTTVYDRMRETNRDLSARLPVFAGCRVEKVRHTGVEVPLGTVRLESGDLPPFVRSLDTPDGGAVVSHIFNGEREYIVVVNRSPDQELTLNVSLAPGTRRVLKDGSMAEASKWNGEYWMDPGEAEIFTAP